MLTALLCKAQLSVGVATILVLLLFPILSAQSQIQHPSLLFRLCLTVFFFLFERLLFFLFCVCLSLVCDGSFHATCVHCRVRRWRPRALCSRRAGSRLAHCLCALVRPAVLGRFAAHPHITHLPRPRLTPPDLTTGRLGIRWWDYGGSLMVFQDRLRLTDNIPNQRAYMWNRHVCCTPTSFPTTPRRVSRPATAPLVHHSR